MRVQTFEIPGRLMGLNEYTAMQRSHYYTGAKAKKAQTRIVEECIVAAGIKPHRGPVEVGITWIEGRQPNGAVRDIDGVRFGAKFILDALVNKGIIPDDSPKYVRHIFDQFKYNETNPRVQVMIMSAAPEGRSVFYAPVTGVKEG